MDAMTVFATGVIISRCSETDVLFYVKLAEAWNVNYSNNVSQRKLLADRLA